MGMLENYLPIAIFIIIAGVLGNNARQDFSSEGAKTKAKLSLMNVV